MKKIEWNERDDFRAQYAVLAKHVLCQRSGINVYQIQRSMRYSKMMANTVKKGAEQVMKTKYGQQVILPFLMSKKDQILGSKVVQAAINLGTCLKAAIGVGALIGIGVVVGIALGAALIIYEYNNTKKKPTLQSQLKKALVEEQFDKIESFLLAYLKCYENDDKFNDYYNNTLEKKANKGLLSVVSIQRLMEHKNYLFKKIKSQLFSTLQIDVQINIAELYYQLVKALIEIVSLAWNKEIQHYLMELKNQHETIKQILTKIIRLKIMRDDDKICIKGITTVSFYDQKKICNQEAFANAIFDEIFRCPVTKYEIDDLYDVAFWTEKDSNTSLPNIQPAESTIYKYLGAELPQYSVQKSNQGCRIRKITATSVDWSCYYENLSTKSGMHDSTWNDPKTVIDLDNILVIYLNYKYVYVLTKDYKQLQIFSRDKIPKPTIKTHYCFELPSSMPLKQILYSKVDDMDLRFVFEKSEGAKGQTQHCKSQFRGFISINNDSYRLGFGAKNKAKFDFSKGYNFHSSSQGESSQKLIFQAVTPINFFPNSNQVQSFTCRITNEYDKQQYMVRDGRQSKSGDFGNNSSGGELLTINFTKRVAKNEYIGTMKIVYNQIYISSQDNMEWTSVGLPAQSKTEFEFYVDQI